MAFLLILFGEDQNLIRTLRTMSPQYILEKWFYYIESYPEDPVTGLHPNLKTELFDKYFEVWGIKND